MSNSCCHMSRSRSCVKSAINWISLLAAIVTFVESTWILSCGQMLSLKAIILQHLCKINFNFSTYVWKWQNVKLNVERHPRKGVIASLLVTQASWPVHTDLVLFIFRTTSSGHKLEPAPSYCIARFCCNYYCLPVASVWRLQFQLFFQIIL